MTIEYELIAIFGISTQSQKQATKAFEKLVEEGFIVAKEVIDIAVQHNVVILYEGTESNGFEEMMLIDNSGEIREREALDLDDVDKIRKKLKTKSIFSLFDEAIHNNISMHMDEHGITEKTFSEEYLDELLMDLYEDKKEHLVKSIKKYYVK